jgi:hypothetical protein
MKRGSDEKHTGINSIRGLFERLSHWLRGASQAMARASAPALVLWTCLHSDVWSCLHSALQIVRCKHEVIEQRRK